MSAISGFSPAANVYQTAERKDFAQTLEAIGGTQQPAFTGDEREAAYRRRQPCDDSEDPSAAMEPDDGATSSDFDGVRGVLNVTA